MKKPEVEVVFEHSHAKFRTMRMTWNGVTFFVPNSFAMLYKLAEYAGMDESAFMEEMKPYYWKSYQEAVRLQELEKARKEAMWQIDDENRRAKDADKARRRRERKKNSVLSPENAVSSL